MKNLTAFLFILLFSVQGFSQSSISGTIKSTESPVDFCSVILMNAQDSTIVKASFTNQKGEYIIEKIDSGFYFIKTQLIGFEEYYTKPFKIKDLAIKHNMNVMICKRLIRSLV